MFFLLCCFFHNSNAQVYIGENASLNIKDSILFYNGRERNEASVYILAEATVCNLEEISNAKIVVLSNPTIQNLSREPLAKAEKKPEKRKAAKKVSNPLAKKEIYISVYENHAIISNYCEGKTAIIITNNFKEKQGVLQNKYKVFAVYENKVFPKQFFKSGLFKRTFLTGIHIRPPPLFLLENI